jgi:hypothetical protein
LLAGYGTNGGSPFHKRAAQIEELVFENNVIRRSGSVLFTSATALAFVWMVVAGLTQERVQSRAYAGHESDRDIQNFIRQYPKAAGTRLDDCQTCHRNGLAGTDTEREYSPCGYCHLLQYPNARYKAGVPNSYEDTLNAYGLAYKRAGRTQEALLMELYTLVHHNERI